MAFPIASSVRLISLKKASLLLYSSLLLWEYPWLPIKWPDLYIVDTTSGYFVTCFPITKKFAFTCNLSRISKTLGVIVLFGPSSKVR